MKCKYCDMELGAGKEEDCKFKPDGSKSAPAPGLCRLPIEAIEVEDEWQLVQDHVEDENWIEVPPALNRMREKMLKLEAHAFAKRVLSA